MFFTKEKTNVFVKSVDQVNAVLKDQRKTKLNREKAALRRTELLGVINTSIGIIDESFNALIGVAGETNKLAKPGRLR